MFTCLHDKIIYQCMQCNNKHKIKKFKYLCMHNHMKNTCKKCILLKKIKRVQNDFCNNFSEIFSYKT